MGILLTVGPSTILGGAIDVEREESANRRVDGSFSVTKTLNALRAALREDRLVVSRRRVISDKWRWRSRHRACRDGGGRRVLPLDGRREHRRDEEGSCNSAHFDC